VRVGVGVAAGVAPPQPANPLRSPANANTPVIRLNSRKRVRWEPSVTRTSA